jgi:endoglucanase
VFEESGSPAGSGFSTLAGVAARNKTVGCAMALAWACGLTSLLAGPSAGFVSQEKSAFETRDGGIVRGPIHSHSIALVFTGHEFGESGERILDQLASHHAKAAFFLTGDFIANPKFHGVVQRILTEGHYLGPHSDKHLLYCSWDHPPKTLVTREEFTNDVDQCLRKIYGLGVPAARVRYFLPAYEHYNAEIAGWAGAMGMTLVDYTPGTRSNADYTGEGDKNFVSSRDIFDSIIKREQTDPAGLNGFILLLHLGTGPGRRDKFADRFGDLLDVLQARGYAFQRIDALLAPHANGTAP